MPSSPRPAIRVLLAAVIAAAALAALWANAFAQSQSANVEVTIERPGKKPVSIVVPRDVDNGNGDVDGRVYDVWNRDGRKKRVPVHDGVSISQILRETSSDFAYATLDVQRPDGGVVTLSRDEVKDWQWPPTFYVDEDGVLSFVRKRRNGSDYNWRDNFRVPNRSIALTQHKLEVDFTATPADAEPGQSVRFDVSVSGGAPGASYDFTWYFCDGKDQLETSERYAFREFAQGGEYDVFVTARETGSKTSVRSPAETVTIGDSAASETCAERRKKVEETTTFDEQTNGSPGVPGYESSPPAQTTPPTPTPQPLPPPPPTPTPDLPDIATDGSTIEGNLLADISTPPAGDVLDSATEAAREKQQRDEDDESDGASVPEAALSFAGLLGLLGLGAGIELRQGRPRRTA